MDKVSYSRHRFPGIVIQQAVWLCFRFALSNRDVEDVLAERGIEVTYETVRRCVLKFGVIIARKLRRGRPTPNRQWHPDEVFISINGKQLYVGVRWTVKVRSLMSSFNRDEIAGRHSS